MATNDGFTGCKSCQYQVARLVKKGGRVVLVVLCSVCGSTNRIDLAEMLAKLDDRDEVPIQFVHECPPQEM